jgi:hypothetical protein
MKGFFHKFNGFLEEDFDTYAPEKWSSNLFNLQRMEAKQKMAALGDQINRKLVDSDLSLEQELTPERPSIWNQNRVSSQWLYFIRNKAEQRNLETILDRKKQISAAIDDPAHHHKHIILGVRLDRHGLTVLCGIHQNAWLDWRNATNKCAEPEPRAQLLSLIGAHEKDLFTWCIGSAKTPLESLTDDDLSHCFSSDLDRGNAWFAVEHTVLSADSALMGASIGPVICERLLSLVPLYRFFSWSKNNDHLSFTEVLEQHRMERKKLLSSPFLEGEKVELTGGLFAGKRGEVVGYEQSGMVNVKMGTLVLPISPKSLKKL